ncbi:glycoside hydrolase family 16 protein [Myxococcus sp. K15C18031901]|uniref:glycoside hydrolase family 16 protein n=1 Tax=Myxococcus dinghuensis TaxID=2906761 RepID=UPI0020A79C11|nr:glycoside hydrolase family 16 protein [Myxococcus dinghuensis]MCP3100520.1 glycoside hydrolase family 16 protein [Myxococcus dinghuensis]
MTTRRLLPWLAALGALACDPARNGRADPPPTTAQPSHADWRLVWQDEFDGAQGSLPSPERWQADVGGDGWGNGQYEHNTARAENASLDGEGHLLITARREQYGGNDFTSARINTRGRFEPTYGRFEARIQLPTGKGIWPAFWMLGADFQKVGWPACGEIDIMEHRGQLPAIVRGSLHGPGYSGGENLGAEHVVSGGKLYEDYHLYAVEWDPERIRWLVDGVVYFEVTPKDLPAGKRWVFDHPHFLILNVAVGGNFVGPIDGTTQFPQVMRVDYVRAYTRVE